MNIRMGWCCLLAWFSPGLLETCWGQDFALEIGTRLNSQGVRSLLIKVDRPSRPFDAIELRVPGQVARQASAGLLPPSWSLRREGSTLRLEGPRISIFPVRFRLDIGSASPPRRIRTRAEDRDRRLLRRRLEVRRLADLEIVRDLSGLLYLPAVLTPGEEIELELLDSARTPPGGRWTIAGAVAEETPGESSRGPFLRVRLPERLPTDTAIDVTRYDPWGDAVVQASAPNVRIQPAPSSVLQPRITGCQTFAEVGSVAAVCGSFPEESWSGLTIAGRPAGRPVAASSRMVLLRIPEDEVPGTKVVAGDTAHGFPASDQAVINVFSVMAELDRKELEGADSTPLRIRVEGTTEVFRFELVNHHPGLVSLEGGEQQIAETSGGTPNVLVREVKKVAIVPGRILDFRISYELPISPVECPHEDPPQEGFVPDQVLAVIPLAAPAVMAVTARALAAAAGLNVIEVAALNSGNTGLIRFRIPDGRAVPALVALLQADPRVLFAQPDYVYETNAQTPPLQSSGQIERLSFGSRLVGADRVWAVSTGRNVTIAIVDTGLEADHVDLQGKVLEQKDFTEQGFSDDIHGTLVAGIIAAEPNNEVGIDGIAPGARILALKACHPFSSQSVRAQCWSSSIAKAIDFAIENKARIINLSVGGRREDRLLTRQIETAVDHLCVVVAAAGNDGPKGRPSFPAALDKVLAVTAVDVLKRLYPHATQGGFVDVAAPGVDIISTAPKGQFPACSGTSFATAFVTGTIALLLQHENLSPQLIRSILEESADDLGPAGKDDRFGAGLLDACQAMKRVRDRGYSCN